MYDSIDAPKITHTSTNESNISLYHGVFSNNVFISLWLTTGNG